MVIHLIAKKFNELEVSFSISYGLWREKTCLRGFENNKGADQPAHPRSLISTCAGFYTKLNVWGSLGLNFDYDGGPIIENGGPIFLYVYIIGFVLLNRCRKTSGHFGISTISFVAT